jgi:hypothetical protein
MMEKKYYFRVKAILGADDFDGKKSVPGYIDRFY